jgi:Family of unknown function (DUF5771)
MSTRRKAYSYMRNGKVVHVPAKGVTIGPLRKGLLGSFGYRDIKHMTVNQRHAALKRAIRELGPLHVERALYAVATYNKRTAPRASSVFRKNAKWVSRLRSP